MAEIFGRDDKGTGDLAYDDTILGCLATSGSAGVLASMTVYIKGKTGQAAGKIKTAIYDASLNLLANGTTEELDLLESDDGWKTFNFTVAPSVEAATSYLLCHWTSRDHYHYYFSGAPAGTFKYKAVAYGDWPATIESPSTGSFYYSKYATYGEAPPPAVKAIVQAALISIPPLIILPTLSQIIKVTGGC